MVEADGGAEEVAQRMIQFERALQGPGMIEIQSGFSRDEIARLWTARKSLSHAVKKIAPLKINEDVVVPVSRLAELVEAIDGLVRKHRLPIVSFGHAGNGNLHVNILADPSDTTQMHAIEACLHAVFRLVLSLDGTLSGEHGVGIDKREFVGWEVAAPALALMHQIKRVFDPDGILNPGKTLPDAP
jgi:D-lactate dehydrogenase